MYRFLADAVVVAHLAFIVFVALGGLLALRRPGIAWAHLPAAMWGAAVELLGLPCPLTPLENRLRALAGEPGYREDFIARHVLPIVYPEGLTANMQIVLGVAAIAVNAAVYGLVIRMRRRARGGEEFRC